MNRIMLLLIISFSFIGYNCTCANIPVPGIQFPKSPESSINVNIRISGIKLIGFKETKGQPLSFAWSKDQKLLAVGTPGFGNPFRGEKEYSIAIFTIHNDITSGKFIANPATLYKKYFSGLTSQLTQSSVDLKYCIEKNGCTSQERCRYSHCMKEVPENGIYGHIESLAFTPNQKTLFVVGKDDTRIIQYDMEGSSKASNIIATSKRVNKGYNGIQDLIISSSSNNTRMYTASINGIQEWDYKLVSMPKFISTPLKTTGNTCNERQGNFCPKNESCYVFKCYSKGDGHYIYAEKIALVSPSILASIGSKKINLWELKNGKSKLLNSTSLSKNDGGFKNFIADPNGKYIAWSDLHNGVTIYTVPTLKKIITFGTPSINKNIYVTAMDAHPTDNIIILAYSNGEIRLYDDETGHIIYILKSAVLEPGICKDGQKCKNSDTYCYNGTCLDSRKGPTTIRFIKLRPDGKVLAVGGNHRIYFYKLY